LLQQSAAQGSSDPCDVPGVVTPGFVSADFVLAGAGAPTRESGALAAGVIAGSAALRSPLRTRSCAGGNAALPADKARRRSSDAARPEMAPAEGVGKADTVFMDDCDAAGAETAADGAGFATGPAVAGETVATGKEALRSPLRTRSAAGGNAVLPAESASRRSIEAARPEMAPDPSVLVAGEAAMACSGGRVSARRRGTR
jgi:hypothetical protein